MIVCHINMCPSQEQARIGTDCLTLMLRFVCWGFFRGRGYFQLDLEIMLHFISSNQSTGIIIIPSLLIKRLL